ncbi:hypothetical protein J8273_1855 [Carpediemonas membranifera]|uniref:Uncharacterized protein n=1 Tax=Carpediemonas membranifera TaxID=201153 RepID=A0A8J6BBH7_9EUKA|nr:hypothetical protein J8273_1855 [Carpediemonas membranifera]|eukprot:KAG9396812.1 hypothetical protein J8273_1855 [Carpediemonas membranifera]
MVSETLVMPDHLKETTSKGCIAFSDADLDWIFDSCNGQCFYCGARLGRNLHLQVPTKQQGYKCWEIEHLKAFSDFKDSKKSSNKGTNSQPPAQRAIVISPTRTTENSGSTRLANSHVASVSTQPAIAALPRSPIECTNTAPSTRPASRRE